MTDRPTMTLDQVMAAITEIANDRDSGADRFRALKMLASTNTAAAVLPDPMQQGEMIERLSRLMKAAGRDNAQAAYQKAFPRVKSEAFTAPRYTMDDFPPEIVQKVQKIRSLKSLYKNYPEIKRPGFPPGYPLKRGLGAITEWCQRAAAKAELDRMQKEANLTELAERAQDAVVRYDNPPPSPQLPEPVPEKWEPPTVTDEERAAVMAELEDR